MQVIVCTGDSHTWGQGAAGAVESIGPVVAGDRRHLPFSVPCYVNQLRRWVEAKTGSFSFEFSAAALAQRCGGQLQNGCAASTQQQPLVFTAEGELFCVYYYAGTAADGIRVVCDGAAVAKAPPARFGTELAYNRLVFAASAGRHTIAVYPTGQAALLYRLEGYGGPFAVVNSGIGSCPADRYVQLHWAECVTDLHPAIAVVEPHTINDWLTGKTPQQYYRDLVQYFSLLQADNVRTVMLTVAPIFGATGQPHSPFDFAEYAQMAKQAAADAAVPTADTHAILRAEINGLAADAAFSHIADDNWHPNTHGHAVYAEQAAALLTRLGWV